MRAARRIVYFSVSAKIRHDTSVRELCKGSGHPATSNPPRRCANRRRGDRKTCPLDEMRPEAEYPLHMPRIWGLSSVMLKGKIMLRTFFISATTLAVAFPLVAHAQNARYADWQADLRGSSTLTEAFTVNESGSTFGFICSASVNRCMYYVSTHTTCDPGSKSAILINTDAGALDSTITCTKFGDTYYSTIENSNDLSNGIATSSTLGIALPMKNGQFKVVRFSLLGANSAIGATTARVLELEKNADHMK